VPVYNVERYIDRCVKSLIEQTYRDIEIILVDDDSPDGCPRICDGYAGRDERIKVIHKKNGGLSDARNAGLSVARGDYVMFVDSDDYISKDACERFSTLADKGYDVIVGDACVEGGVCDLSHMDNKAKDFGGLQYLKAAVSCGKAPMAAWLNIYKREFLRQNELEFKYGILHEDEQFTPRVLVRAQSVYLSDIVFYHYIIRDGSITTKKDKRKNATDFYETCLELERIYRSLEDKELSIMLLDLLVVKYLSLFESGGLYKYGKQYLPKEFLARNAVSRKTKNKLGLMSFSPRIYHMIHSVLKKITR